MTDQLATGGFKFGILGYGPMGPLKFGYWDMGLLKLGYLGHVPGPPLRHPY